MTFSGRTRYVWGPLTLFTYRDKRNLMIWKPIYDSRLNTRVVTVNCSLETNAVIYVALFFLRSLYRVSQNSEKKNLVNPWLTPEPKASPGFFSGLRGGIVS